MRGEACVLLNGRGSGSPMGRSSHLTRQAGRWLCGAAAGFAAVLTVSQGRAADSHASSASSSASAASFDPRRASAWNRLALTLLTPLNAPPVVDLTLPRRTAESPQSSVAPWIGAVPRLSLVARDWGESKPLVGDLGLTELLRTTRSSRMVVTRVRLADGRIAPFAQLGLGEWRVDTILLPSLPEESELAAQTGVGFEFALSPATALAFESDWTVLRPMQASDQLARKHPETWGTSLALRTVF